MKCQSCDNNLNTGCKFCSINCRNKSYERTVSKTCIFCDNDFDTLPCKEKLRSVCSQKCSNAMKSQKMEGRLRSIPITRPCLTCQIPVTRYPSKMPPKVYCSKSCSCIDKHDVLYNKKTRYYQRNNGQILRLRSKWEAAFIHDYLDLHNLDWEYEPERFRLPSGSSYVPDFYVKDIDCWFEIKGFVFRSDPYAKALEFRNHTGNKIRILDRLSLREMGVNLNNTVLNSITKLTNSF